MTREEAIAYGEDYLKDLISACCHIEEKHKDFVRMAIKALEQEPVYFPPCVDCNTKMNEIREAYDNLKKQESCEDAVSRQAVLDELRTCFDTHSMYDENNGENYIIYEDAVDMMGKLPPVTPTTKWIPVSERLPEGMGTYLVTLEYKEHGKAVTTLWYHGEGIGWDLRVADVVVAWMPLLEPYGEGAEECKAPSEWQQDHAILKAHADGANEVIDRIKRAREEVANYSDFNREHLYKTNPNYDVEQGRYLAYEKCLQILDDMIAEVEGKDATERK